MISRICECVDPESCTDCLRASVAELEAELENSRENEQSISDYGDKQETLLRARNAELEAELAVLDRSEKCAWAQAEGLRGERRTLRDLLARIWNELTDPYEGGAEVKTCVRLLSEALGIDPETGEEVDGD